MCHNMTAKTGVTESLFLGEMFRYINNSGIGYCVLRNHEHLPNSTGGSDLDIAVLQSDRDELAGEIKAIASKYSGETIVDYLGSGRFIRILGCYKGEWWGLAIDLFGSIEYRGVEYLSVSKIIERAYEYRCIKVASDDDGVIIALIKELISNGKSRKGYLAEAREIWTRKGNECLDLYSDTLGKNTLEFIKEVLACEDASVDNLVIALRLDVLSKGNAWEKLYNLWTRIRRLWNPPGISVAILGTDGAGKTTVIEAIRPILEKSLHSSVHYEHLRPNWIPRLGKVAGKSNTGEVVEDPHGQKPSGFFGSLVRLGYYAIDYYIGYWIKIHPKLAKGAKLALFDRYYHDFLLDPLRMRLKLPQWLIKLVFIGVPQPQLILCMGADPEVIYTRKPETSLKEVTKQVKKLSRLCKSNSRAVWIDTGESVDKSFNKSLNAIVRVMSANVH